MQQKECFEEKLKCKLVSSLEKVMPDKEPRTMSCTLTGLRKENVSFQIAYFGNVKEKQSGEISCISVKQINADSKGLPFSEKDIRIRKVMLVPCEYPCHRETDENYLTTSPGLYPDLLRTIDGKGFPVISGQWRSLWIDMDIPENAAAGNYKIDFIICNKPFGHNYEKLCETISIKLEILDATLPDLDIPHTEWFHCDCLSDYYNVPVFSEKHWEIIENFIRTAVKRGCNTIYTPLFTPPLDTAVGGERPTVQLVDVYVDSCDNLREKTYKFDFQKFERWIEMSKNCGMKYFEMSHLFTQWGAKATPKIYAAIGAQYQKIFGWDTPADGKEYINFLKQFLKDLISEIYKLGIQANTFFHISDEPTEEQISTYKTAREIVRKELEGFHVIDAISNYEFYEQKLIEEPVCSSDHIHSFLDAGKRPDKLWVYYCTAQYLHVSNRFISMPGSRTRIIGDMIYRHKINGFLHWGYNFYNSQYSETAVNPYMTTDANGAFPSGDPFLVYPGADGMPEESLRLMYMDEAFSDYRAMLLLEKLSNRETVVQCFEEDRFGQLSFDKYPICESYVGIVRENVNRKIKEYIRKGEECYE